jgi:phage gp36-like protein
MALTGLDRWDLHRLRFGFGKLETVTYTVRRDLELEGLLLTAAERFVRDHLTPQKPPMPVELEDRQLELARLFPRDNGAVRMASPEEEALIERYREATIDAKRAEVRKDLLEAQIKEAIADAKGLDSMVGKVSYGWRKGRTTIDARAAVDGLVDLIWDGHGIHVSSAMAARALEDATKEGEGYRAISRPVNWTKGIQ